jgi:hypothetical protein
MASSSFDRESSTIGECVVKCFFRPAGKKFIQIFELFKTRAQNETFFFQLRIVDNWRLRRDVILQAC